MATLDDILTTQKNGVVGINNLISSLEYSRGQYTSTVSSSQTLVVTGRGYLVNFSVTVAGSTEGTVNNASSTSAAGASNALVATPTTIGVYRVGSKFTSGLVVTPGTGQSIVVTYSLG